MFPISQHRCTDIDPENILRSLTAEPPPEMQSSICGENTAQYISLGTANDQLSPEDKTLQIKPSQQTAVTESDHHRERKSPPSIKHYRSPTPSAPMPHIYKKDDEGRRVCKTEKDKPHKSKKGKGKHMDMECCLDPDEYPNPHCYYSPSKYGKYLP